MFLGKNLFDGIAFSINREMIFVGTSFLLADFMDWKEPKTECRSKRLLSYDEKGCTLT